ncbi:MAG: TonB-dependent receptor plug domain-containing protein [Thermodesulfobacteriota bacterium]|nr:TonB-dependent receptor plug domain-containing protein [Thermodesulfobacteriota bacterium]
MKLRLNGLSAFGMAITFLLIPLARAGENATRAGENSVNAEAMVVTATMTEKTIKDAPGSIEIITSRDLKDMNAQTLSDAVENAAGLAVTTESGRNMRPSIRGTGTKHTLVLIDGRRMASGFKSFTGMEQVPVDMIDHIEVLRGPASALYGSDALGGVINIITRKTPQKFILEATGETGVSTYSEGELGVARALAGTGFNDFGILLSGSFRNKNGYDRDGVTPDDGDEIQLGSAAARFSYDISKNHQILSGFEYMQKNAKGLRDIQKMDRERDADDDRLNLFLEYNGKPGDLSHIMVRANHSSHDSDIEMDPDTSMIPGALGDENNAQRQLTQLESRFTSLFLDHHMITISAEGREEVREDDTGMDDDITNFRTPDTTNLIYCFN